MARHALRGAITPLLILVLSIITFAQQGRSSLRGTVTDELGAVVIGATVTITDASAQQKTAVTSDGGAYLFNGLAPGKYTLRVTAKGFANSDAAEVEIVTGQRQVHDVTLKVTIEESKVTVAAETPVSTDSTANANQTVITGKDLDALPDDPDELAAALQALAGPSMGPNGGQIFIDGFSGGQLPSKNSIREIRINQNPFAAENDQPSGRIDVFTKPGTDKLRGSAFLNFNDEKLNSRNPFSMTRPPFQVRQFGGSLSGPLVKRKASYFVDFERRELDDNEVVTATVLDANLNRFAIGEGVVTPRRFMNLSPRIDYAINENNTLVARYSYFHQNLQNNGVNGFSLPERGYNSFSTSHNLQLTETAVLSPTVINETRFQYTHSSNENLGDSTKPTLNVSGAFISGGSQVGHSINTDSRWELQNFTQWQRGTHTFKIGGRARGLHIDNISPSNFGGQYVFTGAFVPKLDANDQLPAGPIVPVAVDSLERYRRTLLFQRRGLTATQIRALGGGAAQLSINTGNPEASVSQFDYGVYGQDDWRVRPNITMSYGLRYEYQTNIHSPLNFAPRFALAWSPGAANSARPPKMVIRFGAGVFYNRFGEFQTLQAHRFNGTNTQQFLVRENALFDANNNFINPVGTALDAFPSIPSLVGLPSARQVTWRVASDLHTPSVYGGGVQVERQLPYHFTMFGGVFVVQIQHVIRVRDINAPLPGSITTANPLGTRPLGNIGDVYEYESSARFNQRQFFTGFNNRFNRSISFFGQYSLSYSNNDADGQGSNAFPPNSYDLHGEYGRSSFDIRHRFTVGGTWSLPWWGVSLNPLIFAQSGRPFNIITGADTNGDGVFSERPAFAPAGTTCPSVNIVCTRFGTFNIKPSATDTLIPRNFGTSPAYFSVNLGVSKTWTFGTIHSGKSSAAAPAGNNSIAAAKVAANSAGPMGGPGVAAGGEKRAGGIPGVSSGSRPAEAKRYSMQFTINFQNLFNRVNLTSPEGNLSSPFFGQSLALNGFGGGGGPGSVGAGNRRVILRVRFSF